MHGAIECRFDFKNRPSSFGDSRGRPPPPTGRIPESPTRVYHTIISVLPVRQCQTTADSRVTDDAACTTQTVRPRHDGKLHKRRSGKPHKVRIRGGITATAALWLLAGRAERLAVFRDRRTGNSVYTKSVQLRGTPTLAAQPPPALNNKQMLKLRHRIVAQLKEMYSMSENYPG